MSNIIPIVSSSPPPYEDSQSHGWGDDDDDDFGNFASAPAFRHPPSDDGHDGVFHVDWSQANSDASAQTSKESSPQKDVPLPSDQSHKETENAASLPAAKSAANSISLANGDDEFADFAAFQDDAHSKPLVCNLPLHSIDPNTADANSHGTTGESTNPHSNSRESTTDSGMFSSDLSPVPKSDSTSECDKIIQSEDETFADLPQDGQQDVDLSPVCQDGKTDDIGEENGSAAVADVCDNTESGFPTPYSEHGQGSPVSFSEECIAGCDEISETDGLEQRDDAVHESAAKSADADLNEEICDKAAAALSAAGDVDDQGLSQFSNTESVDPKVKNELGVNSDHNGNGQPNDKNWMGFATFDGQQDSPENEENPSQIPPNAEPDDLAQRVETCKSVEKEHDGEGLDGSGDFPTGVIHSGDKAVGSEPDISHNCVQAEQVPAEGATNSQEEASAMDTSETICSDKSRKENKDSSDDVSSQISVAIEAVQMDKDDESHQQAANSDDDDFGDFSGQPARTIEVSVNVDNVASNVQEDDDFGDFSSQPTRSSPSQDSDAGDICAEDSDFGSAVKVNISDISPAELVSSTSDTKLFEKGTPDGEEEDEFGDFSARPVPDKLPLKQPGSDDFAVVSSENASKRTEDDGDDFGDFSGQSLSAAPSEADGFGAFSGNAANTGSGDDDDFGAFNSPTASAGKADDGSGWAAFGENTEIKPADDDDFGDFPEQTSQSTLAVSSAIPADQHSTQMTGGNKLEKALTSCFPEPCQTSNTDQPGAPDEEESETDRKDLSGTLGTILKFGLRYHSASQQTWQVVEHPSKRDPRVKLWHYLEDVDGSPAVVYQWIKSAGNSQLFKTLHIDTQNMLIGHKKPAVPIFATGLSLLEPIRGGSRDRNDRSQPTKETPSNLVDPSHQENDKHVQDIPAVDFDWSTSGLTNPLTSKSLDLDFLVVQEHDSSEKLSDEWDWVFESELLDAPRSNVKPLQPLEDILKSVKPTSVRSRRDDSASTQMSEEAIRVLASLPELSFMHSKVLMFPIKN